MIANIRLILAAALVAFWVGLLGWLHLSRVHAAEQKVHAHYAKVLAGINEKTADAAKAFRAAETAWQTQIEKEARSGQERIDNSRRDAGAARDERDRMLVTLARYRAAARTAQDSGTAAAGPATGDALGVLADLLEESDRLAGIYAQTADLAHAAGVTCQNAYDALMPPQ